MPITVLQLLGKMHLDGASAEKGLKDIDKAAKGVSGTMLLAGAGVVTAAAGIGIASLKMAGDFQQGMTTLVTGAGESKSNLQLVSDGILSLARDTGTSTKQLTDGMFMVESAGYHGKAGLDVLKAAAEGAKVGNADLGTVADGVTTILKDFGDTGINATQAVNAMVKTVASGKTHMQDLSQALSTVLPTASAAGIGLNSVMGAMATMTAEGVPAADAATYLRQTMIALSAPSKSAKNALKEIGLSSTEVADAMHKSLPDALQLITDHLSKKFKPGSAAYVAALKDIAGGTKQMQGLLDLTGSHLQEFQGNVTSVGGAVRGGSKEVAGWKDVQGDFNFQADRAKEVVETLMISLGQKLLPVGTQVFKFLSTNIIPALQNFVTWVSGSSGSATAFKVVLLAVGGAIAAVLVVAFVSWAIAAGAAAIATIAAMLPVIAIGAAIALLVLGVKIAIDHWKQITTALGNFRDMVWNAVKPAIDGLGNAFHGLGDIAGGVWGGIKSGINGVIDAINSFLKGIDNIHVNLPGGASFGFDIPLIPHLATGGTVTEGGLVEVGERGRELLSLPRGASVIPLPTGVHAGSSGTGGGGGAPTSIVQLIVDGRMLAQIAVRHAPGIVRQAVGVREI